MNETIYLKSELDRAQIMDGWRITFGRPPPKYLSKSLMHAILEWDRLAQKQGGLTVDVQRALRGVDKPQKVIQINDLKPGVTLVREWNGRTYQVLVQEHGFQMDGKDYSSLTSIAKKITGAKWSGPRFFGLNTKRGATHA